MDKRTPVPAYRLLSSQNKQNWWFVRSTLHHQDPSNQKGSKIFSNLSLSLAPKNCWKGLGQKDIFENTLFKRNVKFPLKTACHPSV